MIKYIYTLLLTALLSGCAWHTDPKVIYIDAACPAIEVLEPVPNIDGNITNGCVCGDNLKSLLRGASALRHSETYYIEQLTTYNKEFTK